MRFSLLSAVSLIGCAVAASNDLQPLRRVIDDITYAHRRLDALFKSISPYDSSVQRTNELIREHRWIITRLTDGTREIRNGPNISVMEAPKTEEILDGVLPLLESNMMGWVRHKRLVDDARMGRKVLEDLKRHSEETRSFSEALTNKLPYLVQPTARQAKDKWVILIESAIRTYEQRDFYEDGPYGDRPQDDRPYGGRPQDDRPNGGRPQDDRPYGSRPQDDRTSGGRPQDDRGRGGRGSEGRGNDAREGGDSGV
jgi:hypothetical protein